MTTLKLRKKKPVVRLAPPVWRVIAAAIFACGTLAAVAEVTEIHSFTNLARPIPDGSWSGLSDARSITSSIAKITGVRVKTRIAGEFNGDLYGYVRQKSAAATNLCVLLNRVGRSATNTQGYADSGLDLTFSDAASNGNVHLYRNVTNLPAGSPLTGLWQPDGRRVDPATVLDTSPVTSSLAAFNARPGDGEWTLFVADSHSGGTNQLVSWELQLDGQAFPVVTWATPGNIVYGTALSSAQLNPTSSVPGTFTFSPPPGTVLAVGPQTLAAVFSPADTTSYVSVTSTVTLVVSPKVLTITVADTNKVFGAPIPAFQVSYSGFVNGDSSATLTSLATPATSATDSSPVGTYSVTATGAAAANYSFNYVAGTLTISKAGVTGIGSASPNPAAPGAAIAVSLTVAPIAPGAGTPTGSVQFWVDGSPAGSPATLSGGSANANLSIPTAGFHLVSAVYGGDGNFTGTSNVLSPALLINSAPVATTDTIGRLFTNSVKVAVSSLLANDSDPDGDPVTFAGVSSSSAGGGTVVLNGNWVTYTPPAGFTNSDSFTYTISDSHGSQATGTVSVVVNPNTAPASNLVIIPQGNGAYLLRFDGVPGVVYRIEFSESLQPATWLPLGSATADANGLFQYVDTPPNGAPLRYYRSAYP
jgi:hypothetical protein